MMDIQLHPEENKAVVTVDGALFTEHATGITRVVPISIRSRRPMDRD